MKLAIFFENKPYEGRDLTHIENGNPGIAATPYLFFLIGHLLAKRDNGIDVTLILTHPIKLAEGIRVKLSRNLTEAYEICCNEDIDYLLIRHSDNHFPHLRKLRTDAKTRLIVWCHNFVNFKKLTFYAKNPLIARLVAVGREQADSYRDHLAFQKTDWIYNCVESRLFHFPAEEITPVSQRKNIVTYVGAVIPGKGFHVLAKAWPTVLKEVPDAQLYVIGNGLLYGDDIEIGKWGLAEKRYESSFMKYLTDDGQLLAGVHLLGILGTEKYDILAQTKVGVPNPSGLTETFCNSAVEMQMMGAAIVSKRCIGYMDTVKNGTLIENPAHLARGIVAGLRTKKDVYPETRKIIRENFSQEVVIVQWEKLLTQSLPREEKLHPLLPLVHPEFELKRWKEAMRRVKERHPWLYTLLPSIGFFTEGWKALKWAVWKRTVLR